MNSNYALYRQYVYSTSIPKRSRLLLDAYFILLVVIILAVLGLGWKTFSSGLIAGFDKAIDVGTPIIKNFDKLVELNKTGKLNDRLATTNGSISYCDRSMS